jgi:hypothetical protein
MTDDVLAVLDDVEVGRYPDYRAGSNSRRFRFRPFRRRSTSLRR